MKNKKSLIVWSVVFVALTVFVYSASNTTTTKRVRFKNQEMVISQRRANITNESIGVNIANTNADIKNQDLNANNQNINIGDNGMGISNTNTHIGNHEFQNQNINYHNQSGINNSDVNINNSGNINNQNGRLNNLGGSFENNFGETGNNGNTIGNQGRFGNADIVMTNKNYGRQNSERYQNIDWSTWKSNFVNRFLEDSLYISSLDFYGIGTWFYYSFDVSNNGEISDIKVFSFYLSDDDKQKIRELIRSYQYQPITIFPADTKREKAKVKAIVLLGDNEQKSRPSDFNDRERVKIQY